MPMTTIYTYDNKQHRLCNRSLGLFKTLTIKILSSVGDYKLDLPHFYSVSSDAKDLISNLIVLNPDSRSTADQGKLKNMHNEEEW